MSSRWCWGDAERCVEILREHPGDRRNLLLLDRLPLAPPRLLQQLEGLSGGASVYRSLARLRESGLVAAWRIPLRHHAAPSLYFPTDLGLAATALDQGIDVGDLVRQNRLRTVDLLRLLPGLPHHLAVYELLGLLAASHAGRPNLLGWEKPWRSRMATGVAGRSIVVTLPAYVALAREDGRRDFLLLPDLGTFPLRLYIPILRRLAALRPRHDDILPTLVVATTSAVRAQIWRETIEEATRRGHVFPLPARVTTWESAPQELAHLAQNAACLIDGHMVRVTKAPSLSHQPSSIKHAVPHFVEPDLSLVRVKAKGAKLGFAVSHLGVAEHHVLDLVGHHPFLPIDAIAEVLGWTPSRVRKCYSGLIDLGLVRFVEAAEINAEEGLIELSELTRDGLHMVASWQGLSLAQAIRENGLVGGGPRDPIGNRRQLLANLPHTLGVDRVFVALITAARRQGGALLEWRNAAACARRRVRPDGYGVYAQGTEFHGFFLEYDRGTMGRRALRKKLAAYGDYLTSGRYHRDYVGFPTILVVATDNAAEERFARTVAAGASGRERQIFLLLSAEWRIFGNRANPAGPLGQVWRVPEADLSIRQSWPLNAVNSNRSKIPRSLSVPFKSRP